MCFQSGFLALVTMGVTQVLWLQSGFLALVTVGATKVLWPSLRFHLWSCCNKHDTSCTQEDRKPFAVNRGTDE